MVVGQDVSGHDGLELLQLPGQAPILIAVAQARRALEEGRARGRRALREVLEVLRIAHVLCVDGQAHVVRQFRYVLQLDVTAILTVVEAVIGQKVEREGSVLRAREVAQLPAEIHAALLVFHGLDGGVHIGRDVPVVRHGKLQPAGRGIAERGKEKAALAVAAQRKG